MEQPLISVIVPVYKVELYLRQCIDSILSQTYTNLEIILVDDGSPDGCPAICDDYAAQDCRIKVIHKENGGLSSARNVALDICTGAYITFVDSDDMIAPTMVEALLTACLQTGSEISVCGINYEVDGWRLIDPPVEHAGKTLFPEELHRAYFAGTLLPCTCAKFYQRSLWNDFRFPDGLIYEDAYVLPKLIDRCHQAAFCKSNLYTQRIRTDSITTSGFSPRKLDGITVAEYTLRYYQAHYPELYRQERLWKGNAIFGIMKSILHAFSYRNYQTIYHTLEKDLSAEYAAVLAENPAMERPEIQFALRHPVLFRWKCYMQAVADKGKCAIKWLLAKAVFAKRRICKQF